MRNIFFTVQVGPNKFNSRLQESHNFALDYQRMALGEKLQHDGKLEKEEEKKQEEEWEID